MEPFQAPVETRSAVQHDQGRQRLCCVIKTANCLKFNKMKALFPLKDKDHDMKTRKILNFKVTKAKTERFRSSPVINMQKLLNKENLRNLKSCKMGTVHNLVPNP